MAILWATSRGQWNHGDQGRPSGRNKGRRAHGHGKSGAHPQLTSCETNVGIRHESYISGWWFQPSKKYESQWGL